MRNLYQFTWAILFSMATINAFANNLLEEDSIQMGAEYANDIFYSLANGEVSAVDRTNWDIGFYTSMMSAGIVTNEGNGVELRVYPNSDITGWGNIDTTGLSGWPVLYNSKEVWEDGAFNQTATGHPDYGWGVYNPISHNVIGDSIYILKFANDSTKKLWIERKESSMNTYYFKYADLDGSNEVMDTVDCSNCTDKNFLYYSLQSEEILDREPASDSWDILFTKYIAILEGGVPYPVTGLQNNIDVPGNRYDEVGPDFDDWSAIPMDSTKVPIGYDWKYFDMSVFSYVVEDSIAFFVSNRETDVYKLVFSVFDYTIGNIVFSKSLTSLAGITPAASSKRLNVYPNPAGEFVIVETKSGATPDAIFITDLSGRIVMNKTSVSGILKIDLGDLQAGMYIINLRMGEQMISEKLLIQN